MNSKYQPLLFNIFQYLESKQQCPKDTALIDCQLQVAAQYLDQYTDQNYFALQTRALFSSIFLVCSLLFTPFVQGQNLSVSHDPIEPTSSLGQQITLAALLSGHIPADPSYLHSWVDATGYRKLKLGNNPNNYYNPGVDVLATGNNKVEITLRVNDNETVWKKMLFRPNGAANQVRLNNYIPEGIAVNEWFTLQIPLSEFSDITDLSQLKNIEFPYSGGANHFDWDIYSIIFSGGSEPFVWLGPGNINNAHNGNGGPGEVNGNWVIKSEGTTEIPEIKLFIDNVLFSTNTGYSTEILQTPAASGIIDYRFEAWSKNVLLASKTIQWNVEENATAGIGIEISNPTNNQAFAHGQDVLVNSQVLGNIELGPSYLKVNGLADGWRKLKIGNNASNLYGPTADVLASGNTSLRLILRNDTEIDWSKIDIRPNGNGTAPVNLANYIANKTDLEDGWFSINIPLSSFDSSIDFTSIANLEFPYSRGAGVFELLIREISFIGGSNDFLWFGNSQTDNKHDGFGNPGQLVAELIKPTQGGYESVIADLLLDGSSWATDTEAPFTWNIKDLPSGDHHLKIQLHLDQEMMESEEIVFHIDEPLHALPTILLDDHYSSDQIEAGYGFSLSGTVTDLEMGVSFETSLLIDNAIVSTTDQNAFNFVASFSDLGSHTWAIQVITENGGESISGPFSIEVTESLPTSIFNLISPGSSTTVFEATDINLQTSYTPVETGDLPYWEISNPGSGYRKLKIGNNPNNLYSPKLDMVAMGHTHISITLNLLEGSPDLNKLVLCPMEKTTNAPSLGDYWETATDLGEGWKTLHIPMADFDTSVDFSVLSYLAFPYSRDAGFFKLGLREISFTGGVSPYIFLGENKLDNKQDGDGNAGQLLVNLVEPNQAVILSTVHYFINQVLFTSTTDSISSPVWTAIEPGNHHVSAYGILSDGTALITESHQITVLERTPDVMNLKFKLTFPSVETVNLQKSTLRYNKKFAYSLTLDDGLDDAYSHAHQILNGGYIDGNGKNYDGLFLTDGCGNDVPFTAGLAWYSVSSNYTDLHTNTPSYTTWNQLIELYNSGWDVLNHSYSHATAAGTDIYWEIEQNQQYVYDQTGITMRQFIIPGGGDYLPYQQAAKDYGMDAIYAYKGNFEGAPKGIETDSTRSWEDMSIYRAYKYDSYYTPANIMNTIDGIANASSLSKHVWYNDFTHRVQFSDKGGSLQVATFEYYMTEIESRYGKSGSDEIWMAPLQQIWEYLYIRDHVNIVSEWIGNELHVTLDISGIEKDLRTKALSIITGTQTDFTLEVLTPGLEATSNPTTGLINLSWDKEVPLMKRQEEEMVATSSAFKLSVYPNPTQELIQIQISGKTETATQLNLITQTGQVVYSENNIQGQGILNLSAKSIGLKAGVYYVQILQNESSEIQKLVITE